MVNMVESNPVWFVLVYLFPTSLLMIIKFMAYSFTLFAVFNVRPNAVRKGPAHRTHTICYFVRRPTQYAIFNEKRDKRHLKSNNSLLLARLLPLRIFVTFYRIYDCWVRNFENYQAHTNP